MTRRARRGIAAALGVAAACLLAPAKPGHAQSGEVSSTECCKELRYTVGARTQSLADATTARSSPSSLFTNPALLAWVEQDQFIVHNAETEIETSNTFSVIVHSEAAGTFGLSYRLLDFGTQKKTTSDGVTVGSFRDFTHVLTASYGTTVGAGVSAGVSYKLYQQRTECQGFCDDFADAVATTHGVDLGVQVRPGGGALEFGAALLNLGLPLQSVNAEQADPMPIRLRAGTAYEVGHHFLPDTAYSLWASGDVVVNPREGTTHVNVGIEFSVEQLVFLRAGYGGSGEPGPLAGGLAAGVGIQYKRITLDIAKSLQASAVGDDPIKVSFSLQF